MPTAEKFGKREVGEDCVRISGNPAPAQVFVKKVKRAGLYKATQCPAHNS